MHFIQSKSLSVTTSNQTFVTDGFNLLRVPSTTETIYLSATDSTDANNRVIVSPSSARYIPLRGNTLHYSGSGSETVVIEFYEQ